MRAAKWRSSRSAARVPAGSRRSPTISSTSIKIRNATSSTTAATAPAAAAREADAVMPQASPCLKPKKILRSGKGSLVWSNGDGAHLSTRRDVGKSDEHQSDEAGDRFGYMHEDGREHRKRKPQYRPMRAVLKVNKVLERSRPHEIYGKGAHEHGSDAKTGDDDGQARSDGERSHDAVEGKGGIKHVEVYE